MKRFCCFLTVLALLALAGCGTKAPESEPTPPETTVPVTTTTTAPRTRAMVTVPEIIPGEPVAEVVAAFEALGLFTQKLEVTDYDVPSGGVISTSPAYPAQVPVGTSITLLVSYW